MATKLFEEGEKEIRSRHSGVHSGVDVAGQCSVCSLLTEIDRLREREKEARRLLERKHINGVPAVLDWMWDRDKWLVDS